MIIPQSSLYWPLVTCNLPSASIPDITGKWNQTRCPLSLLYVSIKFSRLIRTSFLFILEKYSILCINHILFIHSSINGHLSCYLLTIMDNVVINIGIHASSWVSFFSSFEYIPRGSIATSCGKIMFNFWGDCQLVFHRNYTIWLWSAPQFLHILSNACFPYIGLLPSYEMWSRISLWFWFCVYPITNDVEQLFLGLLTICISS